MAPAKHGTLTRLLHLLVAACILLQLADSQLMRTPRPGRELSDLEALAWTVHQYAGLVATAVIIAFWLWLLVRREGTSLGTLLPWFSAERRRALWADIKFHARLATELTLPEPGQSMALPSAIQGAGLLIALAMALTGTFGWFLWTPGTPRAALPALLFDIHGTLANVLWGYVVVHVGAGVLHELLGNRILREMSPLRREGGSGVAPTV